MPSLLELVANSFLASGILALPDFLHLEVFSCSILSPAPLPKTAKGHSLTFFYLLSLDNSIALGYKLMI